MKRMLMGTLAGAAVVLALSAALMAQNPGDQQGPGRPPMGGRGQMGADGAWRPRPRRARSVHLKLTAEQRTQIDKIMQEGRQKNDPKVMQDLHDKLRDAIFADAGPTGDAHAIAAQIREAEVSMMEGAHRADGSPSRRFSLPNSASRCATCRWAWGMGMGMGPMGGARGNGHGTRPGAVGT